MLQRYKDLQDIIAILGMDELSDEDKLDGAARPQDPALPVAAELRRRAVHRARPGQYVKLEDTIEGFTRDHRRQARRAARSRRSTWSARSTGAVEKAGRRPTPRGRERAMADERRRFEVSLVTPEGPAYEGEAEMLIVPGAAGEIGILARHAPLVAMLKAGSTRVHVAARTRCSSSRPAPASSRSSRIARSRSSTTRSTCDEIDDDARAAAARGGAGRARAARARRVRRRPLAARAAHPPRREPARRRGRRPRRRLPRRRVTSAGPGRRVDAWAAASDAYRPQTRETASRARTIFRSVATRTALRRCSSRVVRVLADRDRTALLRVESATASRQCVSRSVRHGRRTSLRMLPSADRLLP